MKVIRASSLSKAISGGGADFSVPSIWSTATYGSGFPIIPVSPPRDAEIPRSIDYPISVNATLTPRTGYGLMPFSALLEAYENVTEVRTPVNLIWRVLTTFNPRLVDEDGNEIQDHPYRWMCDKPDGRTPFSIWLTRFMKSTKVYDAPSVFVDRQDNKTKGLHYIDGSTLFLIVDEYGNTPDPVPMNEYAAKKALEEQSGVSKAHPSFGALIPGTPTTARELVEMMLQREMKGQEIPEKVPAFTQIIKGTPFSFWSSDQIWYRPQNRRMNSPYGESFIEQAWSWIMIIVNITSFELGHYRTGNMPEGFATLPSNMYGTPDRILLAEQMYNSRMSANAATERNRVRFFPDGTKWIPTKKADFPTALYNQAWHNILHTIGIPPSEFGDIPGSGLGGKGFKEGAASDLSRNTLNPNRQFVMSLFNEFLELDGVDDATFDLGYPTEEIDPDKLKTSVYEGLIHATYTLNDALGQLGLNPVEGSVDSEGNPDPNHIANKHLLVAGANVYVVEDMQIGAGGIAEPPAKPQQASGAPADTHEGIIAEQHTPEDTKTLESAIKAIMEKGQLTTTTWSLPSLIKQQFPNHEHIVSQIGEMEERLVTPISMTEIGVAKDAVDTSNITPSQPYVTPQGVDPDEFAAGMKEEQEHAATVNNDQNIIRQIVLDHLREDPEYYTHLRDIEKFNRSFLKVDIENHDGAMIAIMIPDKAAQQLRKISDSMGLPSDAEMELPENMHVTLAYFPDTNMAKKNKDQIISCIKSVALGFDNLSGTIQGYGMFNGQDGKHVIYASLDVPELPSIRQLIASNLDAAGIEYSKEHGFTPHITLSYFPDNYKIPEGFSVPNIPVTIEEITLALGNKFTFISLNSELESKITKVSIGIDLLKHCGVCPEDDEYFNAPISRELKFDLPSDPDATHEGDGRTHANDVEVIAMCPPGLPPKPALWKPVGGENDILQERIGGAQYVREEAAYLLDRCLGFYLVPVAYVTKTDDDEVGAAIYYTFGMGKPRDVNTYAPEWIERAAVLDYIISQQDRGNKHNYSSHPDDASRPVLFDNGLSFPTDPDLYCESPFCSEMLNQPLSDASLLAIQKCLSDHATWTDIRKLLGDEATDKAIICAQRLLAEKSITPYHHEDNESETSGDSETTPIMTDVPTK